MPCGLRTGERRWCDEGPRPSGLETGDGDPARRGSVSTPGQKRLNSRAHITLVSGLVTAPRQHVITAAAMDRSRWAAWRAGEPHGGDAGLTVRPARPDGVEMERTRQQMERIRQQSLMPLMRHP